MIILALAYLLSVSGLFLLAGSAIASSYLLAAIGAVLAVLGSVLVSLSLQRIIKVGAR